MAGSTISNSSSKHIILARHQSASINLIRKHPDLPYVFLIGGFGCGKSFTVVQLCLFLYECYARSPQQIQIGVFGVTIKLLKQTVIADLERAFDQAGIPYRDNSQAGTLTVGSITFVYLAMQYPDDIYAFNFSCCLVDEIDELPSEKVAAVVKAVQERNRVRMPANKYFDERSPFVFFSTTAQGLGGTYTLIEDFKKKQIPYAVVRGRTADNTALDPQQVERLRALYTEDEARAFLDGEFINLTTGRVYHEFDRSKHVCMRFPVYIGETVYVGLDFNYGYNTCVQNIERGGRIVVVDANHYNDMGVAARKLREKYAGNRIVAIPDASGKEIMQGFVEEFNEAGIEILWNARNPSVVERIMAVNKLLRLNQLAVMQYDDRDKESKLDRFIMGLETRDFDDSGKPRKGKGADAYDHGADSEEYVVWHIIHTVKGYEKVLEVLQGVNYASKQ